MYGSFQNRVMEQGEQTLPEVGDGATVVMYSDRHAGTVVYVSENIVFVQEDDATRTDNNGMSDAQRYDYARDPNGRFWCFTKRKNGAWVENGTDSKQGTRVVFGERHKFHDFGF